MAGQVNGDEREKADSGRNLVETAVAPADDDETDVMVGPIMDGEE